MVISWCRKDMVKVFLFENFLLFTFHIFMSRWLSCPAADMVDGSKVLYFEQVNISISRFVFFMLQVWTKNDQFTMDLILFCRHFGEHHTNPLDRWVKSNNFLFVLDISICGIIDLIALVQFFCLVCFDCWNIHNPIRWLKFLIWFVALIAERTSVLNF